MEPADAIATPPVTDALRLVEVKERQHAPGELSVIPYGWHFVSLCLGTGFDLEQRRGRHQKRTPIGRGDAILDPGYENNRWLWGRSVHLVHINLSFALLERIVIETGKESGGIELRERLVLSDPQTARLLTTLYEESREAKWADGLATDALGTYLAVHLLRHYNARSLIQETQSASVSGGLGANTLRRVTEYVQERLHTAITVADMAGVAGVSTYHFIRLFKSAVGVSPHQYVLKQRLHRARHWLLNRPEMTVAEVAHRTGFADQTHLARQLRRATGQTPTQLRQHLR